MRKKRIFFVTVLCLSVVLLLAACGQSDQEGTDQGDQSAQTEQTDQAKKTGNQSLEYRFADREEGVELMMGNKEYFDGFNQNDLDFRMQKKDATVKEYESFAKKQVLNFTDEQKALVDEHMDRLKKTIKDNGYELPPTEQIVFVCTTMEEENGITAYTHGTQIYLGEPVLTGAMTGEIGEAELDQILASKVFHCLTHINPDFRAEMYKIIHFTVQEEDYNIPPSVEEYMISNPDVEHHDSYATFKIDGKSIDCYTAFVTTRHFEEKGDQFFDCGTTALVPVDGSDKYWLLDEASNAEEIFGTNTGYEIDPEECMAEYFGSLLAYGMDGPDGEGYENQEIIQAVKDLLK